MSEPDEGSTEQSRIGCIVAFVLVFVPGAVVSVLGQMPGEEWPFALFYGVLLAAPFAYLGVEGTKAWIPWLVVVALTACFWGALIASVIISVRDQSGVNFGMALVMLASPFIVTVGAWFAVQAAKRS
jgi:hypothetical protein